MARKPLKGVFGLMPLVVSQNQEIDLGGLRENIEFLREVGFHGFICFGCMGEFYAASEQEFEKVTSTAVDAAGGLACVIGATSQSTREGVRRMKYAEDVGADGVMVAPTYAILPEEDAVVTHFRLLNEAAEEIQIMVYNSLKLARGFNITPDLWEKLLEFERVKALKESNGSVIHRMNVLAKIADKINVFSGHEGWFLLDSLLGGKGIVSLFGFEVPQQSLELYEACLKRDLTKATKLSVKFGQAYSYVTESNEVAFLKATVEMGGRKAGPPRFPYGPLSQDVQRKLERVLQEIKMFSVSV